MTASPGELPWPHVVELLGASSRAEQRHACELALDRVREDPARLASVRELLRRGSPHARFAAAWILFRARRPALGLLPALLESLALPDGDRRWEAAHMVATLGRLEPQVAPAVVHTARGDGDPARRRMALFVLRELAPDSPATAETVLGALDDPDPGVRRAALASLVKLAPPPPDALTRSLEILDGHADLRMRLLASSVAVELCAMRPGTRGVVERALLAAREAPPPLVRAIDLALRRLPPGETASQVDAPARSSDPRPARSPSASRDPQNQE